MGAQVDAQIAAEVAAAVKQVLGEATPADLKIRLEEPRERAHGDRACSDVLALAKSLRRPPRKLAEEVAAALPASHPLWSKVEVAGPGFLNFHLTDHWLHEAVRTTMSQRDSYGRSVALTQEKILVEFVSANPTGPLNVVSARAAALGDALASVLDAAGHKVAREFYVNDAGTQVQKLGESVLIRMKEVLGLEAEGAVPIPEGGYAGEYVKEIAAILGERMGGVEGLRNRIAKGGDLAEQLGNEAAEWVRASAEKDLLAYGVRFDRWFSERELHESGAVRQLVERLQNQGRAEEREGAVFLRTTEAGDDKDRVLRKSDGDLTYFAADLAYHQGKFERGFDRAIDLWGPDHHGYIARMKAGVQMLGVTPDRLEVLIVQQVNLLRGKEKVVMSKRKGNIVTLEEVVEEVGVDAARFFFLLRSAEAHLDFDLDLARKQASENPVYYVQYAHARIASLLRKARDEKAPDPLEGVAHVGLLVEAEERELMRRIDRLPELVALCAAMRQPHLLTVYCLETARDFHSFYAKHRIVDAATTSLAAARLALCEAVRTCLANALKLLGVRAPDSM